MQCARYDEGEPHPEIVYLTRFCEPADDRRQLVPYLKNLRACQSEDAHPYQLCKCDTRQNLQDIFR